MIDSSTPNQPVQNYEIRSSNLETQVRDLLPSVSGYGGYLRATNTIVPVVDLTAAAEGSTLGENLQTAIAFGSQTAFFTVNTSTTIASGAGFFRIMGNLWIMNIGAAVDSYISLTDGVTTKEILGFDNGAYLTGNVNLNMPFDSVVFLDSGESCGVTSSSTASFFKGSVRQIAQSNGTLIVPSGFTP